jgi:hypothetical protein
LTAAALAAMRAWSYGIACDLSGESDGMSVLEALQRSGKLEVIVEEQ